MYGNWPTRFPPKALQLFYEFGVPPVAEQTKIANILSTWDEAIETVQKLIDNSRTQKKALMQQLLSGKKRLPGFTDEWKDKHLDQVAEVIVSPVDKKTVSGGIFQDSCRLFCS